MAPTRKLVTFVPIFVLKPLHGFMDNPLTRMAALSWSIKIDLGVVDRELDRLLDFPLCHT